MHISTKLALTLATAAVVLLVPLAGTAVARTTPRTSDDVASAAAAAQFVATQTPALAGAHSVLNTLAECSSGAHTLSHFGDRVYPEMGNGGYTSLHTNVILNYDALTNMFLPGTHVNLTVRSTQCLTDLSFDFERTNNSTAGGTGPNMTVTAVEVDGQPANFTFVQPTYPGDPNGQNDPDLDAHAVSNVNPVSATNHNPPACSPQTSGSSQNGTQCPANKLVVTPAAPIPTDSTVVVRIDYMGRPGVHVDGDGSTEGWFRVNTTAAPNDGSFVTTEPVGTDSWMPLNNHPSAKPTYDFFDTTNLDRTAVANGELVGFTPPVAPVGGDVPVTPPSANPPDTNFPAGSRTWHWHSPEPIANYLVENSIGGYDLTARTSPTTGIQYFEAQASSILATRKALNRIAIDNQEDITTFQSMFDGPFPLTTDGVLVGIPPASFEEEMQGKITFAGGTIGGSTGLSLGTLNHENMHQWFGDNVSEAAFNLTFWKEGFATLGEYLCTARKTPLTCGQPGPNASDTDFENSLINRFNGTGNYGTASSTFWTSAPSNPTVNNLFSTSSTYTRPGTSYVALWRTLGRTRMISAMKDIQSTYGGKSITEAQLEAVFRKWLPTPSASCNARLDQFFPQWWDTPYPAGGALTANKPAITGPGLNGTGFVCGNVDPATPTGDNGWYTGNVSVTWQGFGAQPFAKTGCDDGPVDQGTVTRSCSVATTTAPILTSGAVSETVKHDSVQPVVSYTGAGTYTVDQNVSVDCSASDPTPGSDLASDTCEDVSAPAYTFELGDHLLSAEAKDVAGNTGSNSATFTTVVTFPSLENLVTRFSSNAKVAKDLNHALDEAAKAKKAKDRDHKLDEFQKKVRGQSGKALAADRAQVLIRLADGLR